MSTGTGDSSRFAAHIRLLAAQQARRAKSGRVIGIRSEGKWTEAEAQTVGGRPFRFVQCDSVLSLRETLAFRADPDITLVIVTPLDESEIGHDALARFDRRKLARLNPWSMVETMFQARRTAPALTKLPWMAEYLLEHEPRNGYPAEPSGTLNEETAWSIFLKDLGFSSTLPDFRETLVWSLTERHCEDYLKLPTERRDDVRGWFSRMGDGSVDWLFRCVETGYGPDAAAVGLAHHALGEASEFVACSDAKVRLERFTDNKTVPDGVVRRWAAAASDVVEKLYRTGDRKRLLAILARFDGILDEIQGRPAAPYSRYSLAGFETLFDRIGHELHKSARDSGDSVSNLLGRLESHGESGVQAERIERVRMAVRLRNRFDGGRPHAASNLAEAARRYVEDGAWVDWARSKIAGGDSSSALDDAFVRLLERVGTFREEENRRFGLHLRDWLDAGCPTTDIGLIENVVSDYVAPIAKTEPVLLLVLDGMSQAVFRELSDDLRKLGWTETGSDDGAKPRPTVAVLPTVTETSRVSLLCGRLLADLKNERKGFQGNPELLAAGGRSNPPVLFLKGDLTDGLGGGLKPDAARTLRDPKKRVVGVVLNAIDDHLSAGGQLIPPWTVRSIPLLESILSVAAEPGRVVVLTTDHGHVLERNSTLRKFEPHQRARYDDGTVLEGELRISGPRVLGMPGGRMIAPWTENIRYVNRQFGYHGGITPQECLVPVAVLISKGHNPPKGWSRRTTSLPAWWDCRRAGPETAQPRPASAGKPKNQSAETPLLPLFE